MHFLSHSTGPPRRPRAVARPALRASHRVVLASRRRSARSRLHADVEVQHVDAARAAQLVEHGLHAGEGLVRASLLRAPPRPAPWEPPRSHPPRRPPLSAPPHAPAASGLELVRATRRAWASPGTKRRTASTTSRASSDCRAPPASSRRAPPPPPSLSSASPRPGRLRTRARARNAARLGVVGDEEEDGIDDIEGEFGLQGAAGELAPRPSSSTEPLLR
ncbi:unnamed protein product [Urochloa humidicola]